MNTDELFDAVDEHFLARLEYVDAFTRAERVVEGWFRGELIRLFDSIGLKWEPEISPADFGRKKIDFLLKLETENLYIETKALYHGNQRGQKLPLNIYFYQDRAGISPDVKKLSIIDTGRKLCLLFVYPRQSLLLRLIFRCPRIEAHSNLVPVT